MSAHAEMMMAYRAARAAQEEARDLAVGAYGRDSEEWQAYPRPVTFREWLIQSRQR